MEINAEKLDQLLDHLVENVDATDTDLFAAISNACDEQESIVQVQRDLKSIKDTSFAFKYGFELGMYYAESQLVGGIADATYSITPLGRAVLAAYEAQLEKEADTIISDHTT